VIEFFCLRFTPVQLLFTTDIWLNTWLCRVWLAYVSLCDLIAPAGEISRYRANCSWFTQ